ncbi:MAG: ShlB/FhaC/HecB family hemolysin secretion/activation protein, partial [Methylococcaceae bacterium]|nr:ShlB/FhaC/HecB family hemolysin secretion/activation protein [Methylococcaceae bacterium]
MHGTRIATLVTSAWVRGIGIGWLCLSVAPAAVAEPSPEKPAAATDDGLRFDVFDFRVDGNHLLDRRSVEKAIYRFLGPGKTIDDMEHARQALEDLFNARGYPTVVVELPEQEVTRKRVILHVVEGSVERVRISGSRYFSLGRIRASLPSLAEGKAPHMPTLQAELAQLAGESTDRSVTPIIRAGNTPGKLEMELQVKDQLPLHGSVELNSRNSEHTSRTRLVGAIRYDNLWQRFHSAALQYQVSPENADEVEVWSGTYAAPTGIADTRLSFYGVGIRSNTQLGATVGGLSVVGTGTLLGTRLVKPIVNAEDWLHSVSLGWDYKDFDQAVFLQGEDTGRTPIAYQAFLLGYDGRLRGDGYLTTFSLAAHLAPRGLGNDQKQFDVLVAPDVHQGKRIGSRANFIYATGDVRHQQVLPGDWRLHGRLGGQLADSPLVSNEQYALGGPASVRGYHQAQQLGDHGVNVSVELYTPAWRRDGL